MITVLYTMTIFIRNIGVILSPSTRAVSSYDMEIGSTATGVIEFKNSGYSIDQTVAEMLRIAGDIGINR